MVGAGTQGVGPDGAPMTGVGAHGSGRSWASEPKEPNHACAPAPVRRAWPTGPGRTGPGNTAETVVLPRTLTSHNMYSVNSRNGASWGRGLWEEDRARPLPGPQGVPDGASKGANRLRGGPAAPPKAPVGAAENEPHPCSGAGNRAPFPMVATWDWPGFQLRLEPFGGFGARPADQPEAFSPAPVYASLRICDFRP